MIETYSYRLQALHWLDGVTLRLLLRPECHRGLSIQAGQFFSLQLPSGITRSYSLACAPRNDGWLEAHIRLRAAGQASAWLRHEACPGQMLTISGPFGDCVWEAEQAAIDRVVMLATGTGIAPLKAMLEYAHAAGCRTPMHLYWGGAEDADLYLAEYFASLALRWPLLRFIPVLSNAPAEWTGRRGFVQDVAATDHPDLSSARVYACGGPRMVEQARALLTDRCHLPAERFHADAFVPAQAPAANHGNLTVRWRRPQGDWLTVPAVEGDPLITALAAAGLVLPVCGGQAACGACRVAIDSNWLSQLPQPSRQEQRLLAALDEPSPAHRLACQIKLSTELNGLSLAAHR
ncbi:hypothetical protein C2134_15090 [Chromobacterium sinusclupearum]|uniref:Uncharacterized protein n=1 Tax=Chromobacterium sinusclupearum TaxID=2077146 RepID=A0A2K4MLP4_9NEIS|nr:flavin reductase family protein [Chromobacterium sinusclupearum]POA97970.1 hypothetical protein C2134_15090 [Chromobacterium sinusclupearum]